MSVYNYFRARWSDGDGPVDDAPPVLVGAIESWIASQWFPPGLGVTTAEIVESRLTLLVLHHGGGDQRDLIHLIVVPDRRLVEASQSALQRVFESLWGRPLQDSVSRLQSEFAAVRGVVGVQRVLDRFAADSDVQGLPWANFDAPLVVPEPPALRERLGLSGWGWRLPAAAAISAALIAGGASLFLRERSPDVATGPALPTRDLRVEELEEQVETILSTLRDREFAHRRQLEQLQRAQAGALAKQRGEFEMQVAALSGPPVLVSEPLQTDVAEPDAPPADSATPPEPALPDIAAAPETPREPIDARSFLVVARTARVRAGPSGSDVTRGLLARGEAVKVIREEGDWLEIEALPGIRTPAWLHASLVSAPGDGAAANP